EVVVAVVADALRLEAGLESGARALEYLRLHRDRPLRVRLDRVGQRAQPAPQALEDEASEVPHGLHERALVEGRERLRGEPWIGGIGGERRVSLRRARGDELHCVPRGA